MLFVSLVVRWDACKAVMEVVGGGRGGVGGFSYQSLLLKKQLPNWLQKKRGGKNPPSFL